MKKLISLAPLALLPLPCLAIINFENQLFDNTPVQNIVFSDGPNDVLFSFDSTAPVIEDANNGEFFQNLNVEGPTETGDGLPPPDAYGFLTDADGNPGQALSDATAVGYSGTTWVQPLESGPDLGNFFLRGPFLDTFSTFTIDFVNGTSTSQMSFQIWDIDGNQSGSEAYQVLFYSGNTILGGVNTPEYFGKEVGSSLDGLPFLVWFDAGSDQIDKVEITFTGTKLTNLGLAIDNIDTLAIPEPSTYAILAGLGALGLVILRRRL